MAFAPSKTVKALKSGRSRDDEFDAAVRLANENRGTVYEDVVTPDRAEEIRKGLDRSVKYLNDPEKSGGNLNVSLLKDFEATTAEVDELNDEGKKTGRKTTVDMVIVRFQASERKTVNRNGSAADESDDE